MGADLICHIVVGPAKLELTEAKRASILKYANSVVAAAKKGCTPTEDDDSNEEGYSHDRLTKPEQSMLADIDEYEVPGVAEMEPEEVLKDFLHLWNEMGFRDSATRTFKAGGKVYQILAAGDMSWGDEPDGAAYQGIKAVIQLGIYYKLGLK